MDIVSLGKLIKTLRKEKGITQEELAFKLGVTTSAVSKWETGKNSPDITMLQMLSDIFDISLEEIYHPEATLSSLTSPNTLKSDSAAFRKESDLSEVIPDVANLAPQLPPTGCITFFHKYRKIFFIMVVLLIIFIVGLFIYNSQKSNQNILPVAFRTTEDEHCGIVYEMACVYNGDLELISPSTPYSLQLSEHWINNTNVPAEITIMKVSFYTNASNAKQWKTPNKSIYLVR